MQNIVERMDVFPPSKRREVMRRIRSKETKPEKKIMEFLKRREIPFEYQKKIGRWRVDFYVPSMNMVLEYRSCFWHLHECAKGRIPKGGILGREWWRRKLLKNKERDRIKDSFIRGKGFRLEIIWSCENLEERLKEIFGNGFGVPEEGAGEAGEENREMEKEKDSERNIGEPRSLC